MSKVTVVSRPNRITIASKGVQGAVGPEGPQGAQGLQGPKGDTGDVTPEALAARDAAQEAASAAAGSASTASAAATTATTKATEAAASAALAEQARLLGATIGFATKADMDASLAHPAGTLALVTSDPTPANNGTYRKTGASGSGSWVQSADRVSGLEGEFRATTTALDVSATTGNFAMTLAEAIAAVPASLRKTRFIVRFNRSEEFQFLSDNIADWSNIAKWLRPIDSLAEGRWNLVDERMLYRGFAFTNANTPAFHPDNSVLIIPIHRFYDESDNLLPLTIEAPGLISLGIPGSGGSGFLSATLSGVSSRAQTSFLGITIPPTAAYAYINISYNNGSTTVGLEQQETVFDVVRYARQGYEGLPLAALNRQEGPALVAAPPVGASLQESWDGVRTLAVDTQFQNVNNKSPTGAYLWQIISDVRLVEGRKPLIHSSGDPRKLYISLFTSTVNNATLRFSLERHDQPGVYDQSGASVFTTPDGLPMAPPLLNNDVLIGAALFPDGARARFLYYPKMGGLLTAWLMPTWIGPELSDVKPEVVAGFVDAPYPEQTDYLYQFETAEVSMTSNYTAAVPDSIPVARVVDNGMKHYRSTGTGVIHGQGCLVADKRVQAVGRKTVNVFTEVSGGTAQPTLGVIRDESSFEDSGANRWLVRNQWVHPDICYCGEAGVGGYKYWMVNSIYPYSAPTQEDAELFVSNDGVNWERIRSASENYAGPVSLRLPPSHWNPAQPSLANTFIPTPGVGASFEFHDNTGIATKTIKGYLTHDPAILYHNGYVNVYLSYGFGLATATREGWWTVCLRTQDGSTWEIVREDGSTIPYNAANAMRVFTSDAGVRNHVRYFPVSAYSGTGGEGAPSIVKVSDTEFWWYCTNDDYTIGSGQKFGLVRYPGTSPYSFNFASRQGTAINAAPNDVVWHACVRYYGGTWYVMWNGCMATSTDGVTFTRPNYPFFWRGAQSDLYKASFVVGGDGKVKIAYGLIVRNSAPQGFVGDTTVKTRLENFRWITQTLTCEYASLADIVTRGNTIQNDAYADVMLALTNERNSLSRLHFFPAVRGHFKATGVRFIEGDTAHAKVFCNTRGTGTLRVYGILFDRRA